MTAASCSVDGCPRPRYTRGMCASHDRMVREGLPLSESIWISRRLANVRQVGDCLIWQGHKNNAGYGVVSVADDSGAPGRGEAVHRWFYRRFVGPIPEGLVLDHLCRTPLCVNVDHLEPVTQFENDRRGNLARGMGPGREACKNGHPWTPENVRLTGKGRMWEGGTCRACNTESARKRRGAAVSA